jgi:3'(2'), 5'-bisphosphate nucleotidase
MVWMKELEIAKVAAIEAGKAIMKVYCGEAPMEVEYKEDRSPLTAADKAANQIIVETLRSRFPQYAILSEEEKDNRSRLDRACCFVIDPLDGTKEFLKRNGQFTVNIALAYEHESVMGVIYVPVTGELYYAAKGYGAYKKMSDGEPEKLSVSDHIDRESLRVVASSSHESPQMNDLIERYQFKNLVKMGSSLKGCMIAEGKADIYYRFNPTMEWDTAAMQCIVEEAGAIFRQMDGTVMRYNREDSLNSKGFYIVNRKENLLL